jgi:hypothetical protein
VSRPAPAPPATRETSEHAGLDPEATTAFVTERGLHPTTILSWCHRYNLPVRPAGPNVHQTAMLSIADAYVRAAAVAWSSP